MQRVDLYCHRCGRGELPLCTLALRPQAPQRPLVLRGVALILPLEFGDAVLQNPVVEVLPTKVRVARCCAHLEDGVLNGED
mmetsp:Transcript_24398/g.51836  ORF Transcript_24398/g.51836 Transcript_24398/m.51836 type:complete len:81 (+) Transcript_24398:394-636(+)